MSNIETHINQIQSLLDGLDLQKQCRFAAWCCHEVLKDKHIRQALFAITKTHANHQMLEAVISACWYDYTLINIDPTLELLHEIRFDSENYPEFWRELESLNELLAAVECMIKGIVSHDAFYFANIAENILNYKDLSAEYPISADGVAEMQAYHNEYDIQIRFLHDLQENGAVDLNQYRV